MKRRNLIGLLSIALLFSLPALAQHEHAAAAPPHEVGGGRANIPHQGPPAVKESRPPEEHPQFNDREGHPNAPHVHAGREWVGHNTGPNDPHYHLDHPWAHGHFTGGIGRGHIWHLQGGRPRPLLVQRLLLLRGAV